MNIHIITIAYALSADLIRLYESANAYNVTWHLYLHSNFPDVVATCNDLAENDNVILYPYRFNRGLARSWNDGLVNAQRANADVMMIANDDAYCADGDVHRLAEAALNHPEYYFIDGIGYDRSVNQHKPMKLSLAVINQVAIDTIGYFDENFFPIYFEDIDYYRRAELAGLKALTVGGTHIVHEGSKSRWTVQENNIQHEVTFMLNRQYYGRKWGCADQGTETFTRPFNDERFNLKIERKERHEPYPGHNRYDQNIVSI